MPRAEAETRAVTVEPAESGLPGFTESGAAESRGARPLALALGCALVLAAWLVGKGLLGSSPEYRVDGHASALGAIGLERYVEDRANRLEGRVVDAAGNGMAGVEVLVLTARSEDESSTGPREFSLERTLVTDPEGGFDARGLSYGLKRLLVLESGRLLVVMTNIPFADGYGVVDLIIECTEQEDVEIALLSGGVALPPGTPVEVESLDPRRGALTLRAGEGGRVSLAAFLTRDRRTLPRLRLSARAPWTRPGAPGEGGAEPSVDLPALGDLIVRWPDSPPKGKGEVRAVRAGAGAWERPDLVEEGAVVFAARAHGTYAVEWRSGAEIRFLELEHRGAPTRVEVGPDLGRAWRASDLAPAWEPEEYAWLPAPAEDIGAGDRGRLDFDQDAGFSSSPALRMPSGCSLRIAPGVGALLLRDAAGRTARLPMSGEEDPASSLRGAVGLSVRTLGAHQAFVLRDADGVEIHGVTDRFAERFVRVPEGDVLGHTWAALGGPVGDIQGVVARRDGDRLSLNRVYEMQPPGRTVFGYLRGELQVEREEIEVVGRAEKQLRGFVHNEDGFWSLVGVKSNELLVYARLASNGVALSDFKHLAVDPEDPGGDQRLDLDLWAGRVVLDAARIAGRDAFWLTRPNGDPLRLIKLATAHRDADGRVVVPHLPLGPLGVNAVLATQEVGPRLFEVTSR